jgi:hypothetical protein
MLHIMIINEHLYHLIIGVSDPIHLRGLQLICNVQNGVWWCSGTERNKREMVEVGEIQPVGDGCVCCQRVTHSLTSNFLRWGWETVVCEPHEKHCVSLSFPVTSHCICKCAVPNPSQHCLRNFVIIITCSLEYYGDILQIHYSIQLSSTHVILKSIFLKYNIKILYYSLQHKYTIHYLWSILYTLDLNLFGRKSRYFWTFPRNPHYLRIPFVFLSSPCKAFPEKSRVMIFIEYRRFDYVYIHIIYKIITM